MAGHAPSQRPLHSDRGPRAHMGPRSPQPGVSDRWNWRRVNRDHRRTAITRADSGECRAACCMGPWASWRRGGDREERGWLAGVGFATRYTNRTGRDSDRHVRYARPAAASAIDLRRSLKLARGSDLGEANAGAAPAIPEVRPASLDDDL